MPREPTEPSLAASVVRPAGIALASAGILAILVAALAPDSLLGGLGGGVGWSPEQAKEHQAVSAELHRLTVEGADDPESQQKIREARLRFADSSLRLEEAASAAARARSTLRWGGGAAAAAGLITAIAAGRDGREG